VNMLLICRYPTAASNQGGGLFGGGSGNNQAAQAIDQSGAGSGINQGQAGKETSKHSAKLVCTDPLEN
jgi:hypothetical protein